MINIYTRITCAKKDYASFMALCLFLIWSQTARGQLVSADLPVTNSQEMNEVVRDGNTLYVSGAFSYIGPNTGSGVLLDSSSGTYVQAFPKVNGEINASIPDGQGGVYIGGEFTKVGSVFRNYIAHINSDNSVDLTWNPAPDAMVEAIALRGSRVYFGGYFTHIGGVERNYIAAVDAVTGVLTSWDPLCDGLVFGIAVSDSIVYFGGNFAHVRGDAVAAARLNIAATDTGVGIATSWDPTALSLNALEPYVVKGLLLADNDTILYVWGNISGLGYTTKYGAGSLYTHPENNNNTYATAWTPSPRYASNNSTNCAIKALAISGDTVFLGGEFLRLKTAYTTRNHIGAMTRSGAGTILAWNPNITAPNYVTSSRVSGVTSLEVVGGVVYAGGYFTSVGAVTRSNLAAIDRGTGVATSWNPHIADGEDMLVNTLSLTGSNIFAGGNFNSVNGVTRNSLAAVDLLTKEVTSWDPNVTYTGAAAFMSEMVQYGSNLYISGTFDAVGGTARNRFAAISKTTGLPIEFLPTTTFTNAPFTLAVDNSKLYISGTFTTIGDSARNNVAAVDLTTGNITAWNPDIDSGSTYYVNAFGFSGSTVYMSGVFENVGSSPRKGLAAVDDSLGSALVWNPNLGNSSASTGFRGYAMTVYNSIVYVGGNFDTVGTTGRRGLAAIDASTGSIASWNPVITLPSGSLGITSLGTAGSTLFIGGEFSTVEGNARTGVAAIDILSASVMDWNPQLNRIGTATKVVSFEIDNGNELLYVAGDFTTINDGDPGSYLAKINISAGALPVELVSFSAMQNGEFIKLNWQTATEINNYGFEVQRQIILLPIGTNYSKPDWEKIGFVAGNGNSSSPKDYSFSDNAGYNGKYVYRLKQIDNDGKVKYSNEVEITLGNQPKYFKLSQNYPNPFNPSTTIKFTIPNSENVLPTTLRIYNAIGQQVSELLNKPLSAGIYKLEFDASNLSSGIYFYKLQSGKYVETKKMIILK